LIIDQITGKYPMAFHRSSLVVRLIFPPASFVGFTDKMLEDRRELKDALRALEEIE
jgi:hypothetical protein